MLLTWKGSLQYLLKNHYKIPSYRSCWCGLTQARAQVQGAQENMPQRFPTQKRIARAMVCWPSQVYHLSLQLFTPSSGVRAEKGFSTSVTKKTLHLAPHLVLLSSNNSSPGTVLSRNLKDYKLSSSKHCKITWLRILYVLCRKSQYFIT